MMLFSRGAGILKDNRGILYTVPYCRLTILVKKCLVPNVSASLTYVSVMEGEIQKELCLNSEEKNLVLFCAVRI